MTLPSQPEKELKIKVNIVKRIQKEYFMYLEEEKVNRSRIEELKGEGKDEYTIRKQEEVLEETQKMIPDAFTRLRKGCEILEIALSEFVNFHSPTVEEAKETLYSAKKIVEVL